MRQPRCRLLLLALVLLWSSWAVFGLAATTQPLAISDEPRQELGPRLEAIADQGFDAAAVAELPDSAWRPREALATEMNWGEGLFWLRARLKNEQLAPVTRLLVNDYPAANAISVYQITEGATSSTVTEVGIDRPFDQRQETHRRVLDTLRLDAGEAVTVLWRVESHPLFRFRTALWQPEEFQLHDHNRSLLFGMLYGALLIMAVYNLFLWLALREKHYIFYVIYLLCTGYALGAEEGHVYQYLWPAEQWPKSLVLTLINVIAVIAFFIFSSAFLRMRRRQHTLFVWMRGLGLVNIALLVTGGVFDQAWAYRIGLIALLPFYFVALVAAARLRLRGLIPAGYYLVAILLLVAGVGLYNLTLLGVLPGTDGLEGYNALGTVLMTVFFSLALASKINQLQRDSDTAGAGIASANQEIHRINNELVRARTDRARFEQTAESARQESRAKSEFLATIGHEIRTPMSGVLGMAELLKSTQLDATQLQYVRTIERSGELLLEVITDLMDYAVIEAGAMDLNLDDFELTTLLDDTLAIFTLRAIEKDIELFAEIDSAVVNDLRGDRPKLQQILLNLLSNAFKFTETGEILVRVQPTERKAVNSIELRFEVIDTGLGMSEATQNALFTPFSGEGTGSGKHLGLAISKRLVELMDGEIGVISSPGHGTTFWFTARFLAAQQTTAPLRPLRERRLLLVAPGNLTGQAIQRTAEGWGAQVDRAPDEATTRALLDAQHYDLLIVDQQLPAVSGLTLLTTLHKSASTELPPAILLTGARLDFAEGDPAAAGVGIVLEKPVTHRPLLDALVRGLGLPRLSVDEVTAGNQPTFNDLAVLVVEDNPVNQLVIVGLLRQLGVTPKLVQDGLSAVDAFQELTYDVVLMDCEMPNLDGYEATRQLRSLEQRDARPPARIVGVSAHAGSDYRDRALTAGMNSYLSKPINLEDLIGELQQAPSESANSPD